MPNFARNLRTTADSKYVPLMADKRILFVTQEVAPYLTSRPLADQAKKLAEAFQGGKCEVRIFTPKYGAVNERRNQLHEVIRLSGINITIEDADYPLVVKVASLQPTRIQVYFIDSDEFFRKSSEDADPLGSNRDDNEERAIFFARGTTDTVKKLRWEPVIVQCAGWISALTPTYLRRMYAENPPQQDVKIIYCVLPGKITGELPDGMEKKFDGAKMPAKILSLLKESPITTDTFHKIGIAGADAVIIADPDASEDVVAYAKEKGVPVMSYDEQSEGPEAYSRFYDSLKA